MYKIFRLNKDENNRSVLGYDYLIVGEKYIHYTQKTEKSDKTFYNYLYECWCLSRLRSTVYMEFNEDDLWPELFEYSYYSYADSVADINDAITICKNEMSND